MAVTKVCYRLGVYMVNQRLLDKIRPAGHELSIVWLWQLC